VSTRAYVERAESARRGQVAAHAAQREAHESVRRLFGAATGWWGPAVPGRKERYTAYQAHAVAAAIEAAGRYWATADQLGQGAAWVFVRSRVRPYPEVARLRYPGDEAAWLPAPPPVAEDADAEREARP
jgi:hypothetical protein